MTDKPLLPDRVIQLGTALQPIIRGIDGRLQEAVDAAVPLGDESMHDVVGHHMKRIEVFAARIGDRVAALATDVLENQNAGEADVQRAVGRFEAHVEALLDDRRDLLKLDVRGVDLEARPLLDDAYAQIVNQVRDWLQTLVDVIADPLAALRRRGLPTRGQVELPLSLTLEAPPSIRLLAHWAQRKARSLEACECLDDPLASEATRKGKGFWSVATIVALAIGIGYGS